MADKQQSDILKPNSEQRRPPQDGVNPEKSKERQTEVPPEASRRQGSRQSDKS